MNNITSSVEYQSLIEESSVCELPAETEPAEIVEVQTYASSGNVNHMLETLPLMGKGMLGIFVVTVLIIISVVILNKTTGKKKKDE